MTCGQLGAVGVGRRCRRKCLALRKTRQRHMVLLGMPQLARCGLPRRHARAPAYGVEPQYGELEYGCGPHRSHDAAALSSAVSNNLMRDAEGACVEPAIPRRLLRRTATGAWGFRTLR